ncbi:MAG: hypothetical protein ACLPWS_04190 [Rhodomicrobium sp.]
MLDGKFSPIALNPTLRDGVGAKMGLEAAMTGNDCRAARGAGM